MYRATWRKIREANVCEGRYLAGRRSLRTLGDDEYASILLTLEHGSVDDFMWVLRVSEPPVSKELLGKIAAEIALPLVEGAKNYPRPLPHVADILHLVQVVSTMDDPKNASDVMRDVSRIAMHIAGRIVVADGLPGMRDAAEAIQTVAGMVGWAHEVEERRQADILRAHLGGGA